MTVPEIENMDTETLLAPMTFAELYDTDNIFERTQLLLAMEKIATKKNIADDFKRLHKAFEAQYILGPEVSERKLVNKLNAVRLDLDKDGNPAKTIENFIKILDRDPEICDRLHYNELLNTPERSDDENHMIPWKNSDDAWIRHFIENNYKLYNEKKLYDALSKTFEKRRYHPIKDEIERTEWDGKNRIGTLFTTYLKAEDTPYTRECERLLFAGGINRLYNPGCKFDCMVIFVGGQGSGKSTICRWLAIKDEWHKEITDIDGQRGVENIRGSWIDEFSELLALKRTKDREAIKSFITRQIDSYRPPFERRVESFPRQCIFVGTTNSEEFINDASGGRRFFPVHCYSNGRELYDHEEEIKDFIKQCWAEAYSKREEAFMTPVERSELSSVIKEQQSNVTEDNYRVGIIRDYLENTEEDRVCIIGIWENALNEINKPRRIDSNEISEILSGTEGWKKLKSPARFKQYGLQRAWERVKFHETEDDFEF